MSQSLKFILILFVALALVSCSGPKTISRDQLRSDLLAALSLASETELFIGQLQEGRVTTSFAKGHLEYLRKEALRNADQLGQVRADGRMAGQLEKGRAQLDFLVTLLADLKDKSADEETLSAGKEQAEKIRLILEHAKDEL
jgi:hypothetical protein